MSSTGGRVLSSKIIIRQWKFTLNSLNKRMYNGGISNVCMYAAVSSGLAVLLYSTYERKVPRSLFNSRIYCRSDDINRIIEEADLFYEKYIIDRVYVLLYRHRDSDNPELLWRLARIVCEKARNTNNMNERKRLFQESFEIIKRAMEYRHNCECSGIYKWYGIILSSIAVTEGLQRQMKCAYEIRDHFEKALELDKNDPTVWHLLGSWHFAFADLPIYLRLLAKAFLGKLPEASYETALEFFEKAESIQPNFYSRNTWYMGLVHERLGNHEKAKDLYTVANSMPIISADDLEIHELVSKKLRTYGISVEGSIPRKPSSTQKCD